MNNQEKHTGRVQQTAIYLGKLLRMFIYQSDWKVLPMGALIAGLVTFVVGANLFVTQEGTLTGCFAMVCICIWNGFFNSIQSVCREREIVKREHRAGLHMSSYIAAHMIYQMLLCIAQVAVTLVILRIAGVRLPQQGTVFAHGTVDVAITLLLITYAADMMSLMVSSIVRDPTKAMTAMPFLLIFQLVFSGGFFQLSGFSEKITVLTISKWGLNSMCAIGRYNELPMVTLWNTLLKFQDLEIYGIRPVADAVRKVYEDNLMDDFNLWAGTYNQNSLFVSAQENVLACWGAMIILAALFAVISVIALEFIDRDRR